MLLFVFGPPAVGKMAVGRAIAEASDFRLFHNHATIEPLLDVFDYGTPAFVRLNAEMRRRILEEAAMADVNLVQTFGWALEQAEDAAVVEGYLQIFLDAGREVRIVELYADLRHAAGAQRHVVPPVGEEVEARPGLVGRQRPRARAVPAQHRPPFRR